jgi:hypothetical protein
MMVRECIRFSCSEKTEKKMKANVEPGKEFKRQEAMEDRILRVCIKNH